MTNILKLRFVKAVLAIALFGITGSAAHAAHYTFTQTGFSGGGSISGSFDASDDDQNGWIDTWNDASFKNFQLTFSGDSLVSDFSANFMTRLTYKVGSGIIGVDYDATENLPASYITEAIVHTISPPFSTLFAFSASSIGGSAIDYALGKTSSTTELIHVTTVSDVPLPASGWLFVAGISGLMMRMRKIEAGTLVMADRRHPCTCE